MSTIAILHFVSGWWDELTIAKQIFFGIGIIAGVLAIILMVLAVLGLEHHDAMDLAPSDDATVDGHDNGSGLLSVKPIVGFLLGFGWCGGLALEAGLSIWLALACALAAGAVMMLLIYFLARAILGMRSDGTVRIEDSVGAVGTVYLSIPAKRGAGGQVIVNFKGRQETYSALTASDSPLPSGSKVKVVSLIDSHSILVEPLA
jgi:membrane protein implicated in regulation of membrane protease activity